MRANIHTKRPDLKPYSTKQLGRFLKQENRKYPNTLIMLPRESWPENQRQSKIMEVWRSSKFLVQVYYEADGIERLSIQTTRLKDNGEFEDNIPWEVLQKLKKECGRGDKEAVEIFPCDKDVVNVANMRHLWILTKKLDFTWRVK